MAYPEKVTYNTKYNLRAIEEPDGQWSAENANHIKEKINKNALFYGVHDNLSALQSAFPEPPVGAFAYLKDGSHYHCVNIGWVTNEGGGEGSSYFYGYHLSLAALENEHPVAVPGARAIIKVEGGNDQEALWDEDDQEWFVFQFSGSGSTQSTKLKSFHLNWQQDFDFTPTASWIEEGVADNDSRAVTLSAPPAITGHSRIDLFVINLSTDQIEVLEGTPAENPTEPEYDPLIHLKGPFVITSNGATQPDGFSGEVMYAEGNEWSYSGGADFDFQNPENPKSGNYAIKTIDPLTINQSVSFSPENPVPMEGVSGINYSIQNITGGAHRLLVQGEKSNGRRDSLWIDAPSNYDAENTASYQDLTVNIPNNNLINITRIALVSDFDGFEYYLDDVHLISGAEDVSGDYVTQEELEQGLADTLQAAKDYADSLVIDSGDHVHDSYGTMAEMIADQGNQIDGDYFVVTDASGHSTVDAGWAFFEYLGTTVGDETDYRKLSEEESLDIASYDYSQDIADVQAEVDALEVRVADLEDTDPVLVAASRNLTADDSGKKLCSENPGIEITLVAGLGAGFEFNAATDSSGTFQLLSTDGTIDGGTFLPENSIGHVFRWPNGNYTTYGDWE